MTTTVSSKETTVGRSSIKKEWAPRIWQGCDFLAWLRLLAQNRFAVSWRYVYIAVIVTLVSIFHTVLRCLQQVIYGRRISRVVLPHAPLFIIGHWRTGTTLLHELLILDERHTYPNTCECFEPNHFLLTEGMFRRWLRFLVPSRRPMDNMPAGWEHPQEDEFALCMIGQPSPYLTIAFPNHPPQFSEYFALEGISDRALGKWKRAFHRFLQRLTLKDPRRLVLKSPPHTCRIKVLLDLYPEAQFIHIVRDPHVVFPSTVKMWKALYLSHGLQKPTFRGLEEYVFQNFTMLYEKLEEGKKLIRGGQFHELRYEDLIRDPVGQMRLLYDELALGEFDRALPRLRQFLKDNANYETNHYELSAPLGAEIDRRWGTVIERYGYGDRSRVSVPSTTGANRPPSACDGIASTPGEPDMSVRMTPPAITS
jgi:omega-hydroxy-beta-dihydromenaquinone-9 sulfotransferase